MKPIKTDLDVLITYLEKEQRSLKKMMRDAAKESENVVVFYHSEALTRLNRKLNTLYSFRDPLYNRKQELKRQIKYLNEGNLLKHDRQKSEYLEKYVAGKINKATTELQRLNDNPKTKVAVNSRYLDDALLMLSEKRCKSFKIIVWEEDNISLHFKFKKGQLIISLNRKIDFGEGDFVVFDRVHQPLKGLGFNFNEQQKKYFIAFCFTSQEDIGKIKMWLSRFFIDYWNCDTISLVYN